YQKAIQHRDEAMKNAPNNGAVRSEIKQEEDAAVATAKSDLDKAVAAELNDKIATVNNGTPAQYQTPPDKLISAYGNQILQRHANDPAAQTVLGQSINDFSVHTKANALIPSFGGNWTPGEKLARVHSNLAGQPPEVVDAVMHDPRVQQWLKDAVNW